MTQIISKSNFVRIAPDKLRLVANTLKGKKLDWALKRIKFIPKAASHHVWLLLSQAKAQIQDKNIEAENVTIKNIQVDEGPKLKRRRIIHRGRATSILKRRSHIKITLEDQTTAKEKSEVTKIAKEKDGSKSKS